MVLGSPRCRTFTVRSIIRLMVKQGGEKFTWVIEDFFSLESETCHSGTFEIGGCNCRLSADLHEIVHPELFSVNMLISHGPSTPPTDRRRYVKYRLTLMNQLSEKLSLLEEGMHWFDSCRLDVKFRSWFVIAKLHDDDGGFLVDDEVKIVVEVKLLEGIDKLYIPEEFKKITRPPGKIEENNSVLLKEASTKKESIDVNGFQVFPSQVESVRLIFERHPDTAVGFRSKNQHLRNSCMFSLLSIIETLCQSLQKISNEDLMEADVALTYVKDSGFKVDWLEKKLDQVIEKKEKELSGLTILQETKEKILKLKQKCSEMEEELLDTRTPLSFDDVV